jgi:hypothetical protein
MGIFLGDKPVSVYFNGAAAGLPVQGVFLGGIQVFPAGAAAINWSPVLESDFGDDVIAAYDFRDISGSTLAGRVGPTLNLTGVTGSSDGGIFGASGSSALAASTVSVTYPHTLVFVAKSVMASAERQYFALSETTLGEMPQVAWFSRTDQSLMPFNGTDNQQTNYVPDGTEWYYAAASFLNDGTVRYQIRAASGNLNGTLNGSDGDSGFAAYPNSGVWFDTDGSMNGTLRLATAINAGFATEGDMNDLFDAFQAGPIADLFPSA